MAYYRKRGSPFPLLRALSYSAFSARHPSLRLSGRRTSLPCSSCRRKACLIAPHSSSIYHRRKSFDIGRFSRRHNEPRSSKPGHRKSRCLAKEQHLCPVTRLLCRNRRSSTVVLGSFWHSEALNEVSFAPSVKAASGRRRIGSSDRSTTRSEVC